MGENSKLGHLHPHTIHDERFSLSSSTSPFYLHLHFPVLFLSFLSMYSDDIDSVTKNLRDDGYDVAFPLTDIVDNYRTMFESRISAGGVEKLPFSQNIRISSWSYDMVGHAKKCVERYCELANKTTQQLYKVSTPCIDDHHFKEEEMKSVAQIVTNMLSNCSKMPVLGTDWET